MYKDNKILVVIPARGGSKGIPRKNIRMMNDKPLIAHTINHAKSSEYIDNVVVSTDDDEIKFIAEKFGADVIKRSILSLSIILWLRSPIIWLSKFFIGSFTNFVMKSEIRFMLT